MTERRTARTRRIVRKRATLDAVPAAVQNPEKDAEPKSFPQSNKKSRKQCWDYTARDARRPSKGPDQAIQKTMIVGLPM